MEEAYELLANQVFIIEREVFYDAEDDGVCENACVELLDSVVG